MAAILLAALLPGAAAAMPLVPSVPVPAAAQAVAGSAGSGDWPQWMGGADHAGYNAAETTLSAGNVDALRMAWYAAPGIAISGGPVVQDGVVYVGNQDYHLYAYPADCGQGSFYCTPIWVGSLAGQVYATPAVANGVVYAIDRDHGRLYAFTVGCRTDGGLCQALWTANTGDLVDGSPVVSGGVVYVASEDHNVYAFDAAGVTRCSGTPKVCLPLWYGPTGDKIYSTPSVSNGVVYVNSSDGRVYAFAVGCKTGGAACTPIWKSTVHLGGNSSPTVANGHVYVGSNNGLDVYAVGCATAGGTCEPDWVSSVGVAMDSSPAVANGFVYIGANDQYLYAFDANGVNHCGGTPIPSCDFLWRGHAGSVIVSAPTVANGVVYVGSNDFVVYAFKADCSTSGADCSPLWSDVTGNIVSGSPAVSHGTLYVTNYNGRLYAYSLGSDWPQFQSGRDRTGSNAYETAIAPDNVAGLKVAWKGKLTAAPSIDRGSAVVAHGMVYVPTSAGHLYAYAVDCAKPDVHGVPAACEPMWEAQVSSGTQAILVAPAVFEDRIYVVSNDGTMYAYDSWGSTNCSGDPKICLPVWRSQSIGAGTSAPVYAGGFVYIGSGSGDLYVFDASAPGTHCGGSPVTCTPVWIGHTSNSITWATPAVANGAVYIGNNAGDLSVFDADGCGGSTCDPLWVGAGGASGSVSGTVATPDLVYVSHDTGELAAFSTDCATASCDPVWNGKGSHASPAVADGVVYEVGTDLLLRAYAANCASGGNTCVPIWSGSVGGEGNSAGSSPVVANGVVYVGSEDTHLYAFAVGCATGGHTCTPLWTSTFSQPIYAAPAISAGALYVPTCDGYVYAFKIEGGIYAGATYHPGDPKRILDTRPDNGNIHNIGLTGKFTSGTPRNLVVGGATYVGALNPTDYAVPLGAVAITGNLTVTNMTARGTVTLGPSATAASAYTTINVVPGDNRANNVTVGLAPDGTLNAVYRATAGATTDLVLDVTGYFSTTEPGGYTYHSLSPGRILDSRPSSGGIHNIGLSGKFKNTIVRTFNVVNVTPFGASSPPVPTGAKAVTGNLTVTNASSGGFVAIGPTMDSLPSTSTLNVNKGRNRANGVTVGLNSSGQLQAVWIGASGSSADVVFDVTGYFTDDLSGAHYFPIEPNRVLDTTAGKGLSGKFTLGATRILEYLWDEQVPADASGISGNLTVVNVSLAGYAYISPFPVVGVPSSSTINVDTGVNAANGFDVRIGSGGDALIWESTRASTADFQLDITGYWK